MSTDNATDNLQDIIKRATDARQCALARYSNFCVGAALEAEGGVYTGCNVESAAYEQTICAERVAIWKALSEGERKFRRLCVVVDTERLTPPCGPCRTPGSANPSSMRCATTPRWNCSASASAPIRRGWSTGRR